MHIFLIFKNKILKIYITDIYLLYQVYNNQLIMNGIQEIKKEYNIVNLKVN